MPLSPAENPPEFPPGLSPAEVVGPWCAVLTLARREKALARYLLDHAVPYYLPMVQPSPAGPLLPLFSGVLFLAAPALTLPVPAPAAPASFNGQGEPASPPESAALALAPAKDSARRSRHVFGFLDTALQLRLRRELCFLAAETPAARTLKAVSLAALPPGTPINILSGPFAGLSARFETAAHLRIVVELQLLGRAVSVALPPDVAWEPLPPRVPAAAPGPGPRRGRRGTGDLIRQYA